MRPLALVALFILLLFATSATADPPIQATADIRATECWFAPNPRATARPWQIFIETANLDHYWAEYVASIINANRTSECITIGRGERANLRCAIHATADELYQLFIDNSVSREYKSSELNGSTLATPTTIKLTIRGKPLGLFSLVGSGDHQTIVPNKGYQIASSLDITTPTPAIVPKPQPSSNGSPAYALTWRGCESAPPHSSLCSAVLPSEIIELSGRGFFSTQVAVAGVRMDSIHEVDLSSFEKIDSAARKFPANNQFCAPTQLFSQTTHYCLSLQRVPGTPRGIELKVRVGPSYEDQRDMTSAENFFGDTAPGLTLFQESFIYLSTIDSKPVTYSFTTPSKKPLAINLLPCAGADSPIYCGLASKESCQSNAFQKTKHGTGAIHQLCAQEKIVRICTYSSTLFKPEQAISLTDSAASILTPQKGVLFFRSSSADVYFIYCKKGSAECAAFVAKDSGSEAEAATSIPVGAPPVTAGQIVSAFKNNPSLLQAVLSETGKDITLLMGGNCATP